MSVFRESNMPKFHLHNSRMWEDSYQWRQCSNSRRASYCLRLPLPASAHPLFMAAWTSLPQSAPRHKDKPIPVKHVCFEMLPPTPVTHEGGLPCLFRASRESKLSFRTQFEFLAYCSFDSLTFAKRQIHFYISKKLAGKTQPCHQCDELLHWRSCRVRWKGRVHGWTSVICHSSLVLLKTPSVVLDSIAIGRESN